MKRILRLVLGLLAGLVGLLVGTGFAARFADGPIVIFAGGPFETGERVEGPEPDWSFIRDVQEVQFQLFTPPRSRTTWILFHEGRIYIPSGYMTTWWGKIWKQWPHEALEDGRAVLRVDGKLYDRTLVRVEEGPEVAPLIAQLGEKYLGDAQAVPAEAVSSGYLWLFELAPRG